MISQNDLLNQAKALEGLSFLQLAREILQPLPANLTNAKGWIGQAVEKFLGAESGCLPQPDFPKLNIELKTLPIDKNGRVMESTYVTHCSLMKNFEIDWWSSVCYQKLQKVLWIPIEGDKQIPFPHRRIGQAILWSADEDEMQVLQEDWNLLTDMIMKGEIEKITGSMGSYIHIRPKAANSRVLTQAFNSEAQLIKTLPRGFYLRTVLTNQILLKHRICH